MKLKCNLHVFFRDHRFKITAIYFIGTQRIYPLPSKTSLLFQHRIHPCVTLSALLQNIFDMVHFTIFYHPTNSVTNEVDDIKVCFTLSLSRLTLSD